MKNKFLQSAKEKIIYWDRQNYHQLARSMTYNEIRAMRHELLDNCYPIENYDSSQPDYKEQIVFHYILFLLYEAEYCDKVDADIRKLYDILFYL